MNRRLGSLFRKTRRTIGRHLVFFQPTRRSVAFASRAVLSALLALSVAVALGFTEIGWAAITVWVLALPRRGMVMAKAGYRVLGTLIGAGAAFLLLPLQSQPFWFVLLMSAWLGLCAAAANLFSSYRAYCAQLAGYTAPIVAVLAYSHAGSIQHLAMERVACVLLGIAASTLVTLVFSRGVDARDVEDEARALASQGVKWAGKVLERAGDGTSAFNHGLLAKIADLNLFSENAAVESTAIRLRLGAVRQLITAVLSLASAARAIERVRAVVPEGDLGEIAGILQSASETLGRGERPDGEIAALKAGWSDGSGKVPAVARQVVQDRLGEMADGLERISSRLGLILTGPSRKTTAPPLAFHRDWLNARSAGLRTSLATLAVGALWIGLSWHGGSIAFVFTALVCVIFANHPVPTASVRRFAIGVGLAVAVFVLWKSLPVSHDASFGMTLGVLVVLTFCGAIALANNVQPGMDFNANVSQLMVGPAGMLVGGTAAALAGADLLAGIAAGYLAYALPPGGEKRREAALSASVLEDLAKLAHGRRHPAPHEWEAMMYDRLYRSGLAGAGPHASRAGLRHCLLGLDMGLEVLRLQQLMAFAALGDDGNAIVEAALAEIAEGEAAGSLVRAGEAADRLLELRGGVDAAPAPVIQAAGAMKAIARCGLLWTEAS